MRCRLFAVLCAGCHVVTTEPIIRPGTVERVPDLATATARPPTLELTATGQLRFLEPLECSTEELVTHLRGTEHRTGPNLATFVVGIVATAIGGVLTVRGASDPSPGDSPYLYGGLGLAAGGLPLAIGPWLGHRTELVPDTPTTSRRAGPRERCGERPVGEAAATLAVRGLEVHGRIDRDGVFSVSPYELVDAFDPGASGAWEIRATLGDDRVVVTMLDGGALATAAPAFLARSGLDVRIEPMRLVAGVVAGPLRASLTSTSDGPAVRIAVRLDNQGPGPAWALRGRVIAPAAPALDGRVVYAGALTRGEGREVSHLIAIDDVTAARLRDVTVELSLELRDAHGTAPTTPLRFRGPLLRDAPR
jgi:hypothetical protein